MILFLNLELLVSPISIFLLLILFLTPLSSLRFASRVSWEEEQFLRLLLLLMNQTVHNPYVFVDLFTGSTSGSKHHWSQFDFLPTFHPLFRFVCLSIHSYFPSLTYLSIYQS